VPELKSHVLLERKKFRAIVMILTCAAELDAVPAKRAM
jgi:hypothetical protein